MGFIAKGTKRIAKIAGIAIIAKIFPRVAASRRTIFNFGNCPILAIVALLFASFALFAVKI